MPAEWQHSKVNLRNVGQKTKTSKTPKILFHICKCRSFRKSHRKSEPELGMPAEWQHSKVSLRNVGQKQKLQKRRKSTKCYIYFYDFQESPANNFYVISHLQVSQIPKTTSKKWTGTWNASRMTTFQGQSAKRFYKNKNFKNAENQRNATFIFMTFRNDRQKNYYVISHQQVSQIPKVTSKKWTGTWNASRMTTFQGQSAKR